MPPVWPFVTSHSPLCTPPRGSSPLGSQVLDDRHPAADRSAGAVERRSDPRRSVGNAFPRKRSMSCQPTPASSGRAFVEQLDDRDRRERTIGLWSRIRSDQEVLRRRRSSRRAHPENQMQLIGAVELDEGSVRYALRHTRANSIGVRQGRGPRATQAWARSPSGAHDERRCSSRPGGARWPQPDSPRCAGSDFNCSRATGSSRALGRRPPASRAPFDSDRLEALVSGLPASLPIS